MINSVLEKNLTPNRVADFRLVFPRRRECFARVLAAALPTNPIEAILPLTLPIFAQVAGLWPPCYPSPGSKEMLERPEFAHLIVDFEVEMSRFVELI